MSGDATEATPPPLPSVFISYSSADRAAARLLRDALMAAGLEVWLDEDELAGGEAWDAKLRNQIRTCTYFMPVISASTETRREGYFRREWRLAVERTLDFADDVMFLVPVVIDDTPDAGARVPEKFFTVQWLRVPGGAATPALRELAKRLARGDAVAAATPSAEPRDSAPQSRRRPASEPPPFPPFPAFPEHGHRARFVYDLVIWFGRLLHSFWGHLPRWVRVLAAIFIIFNFIGWVFRESRVPPPPARKARSAEVSTDLKEVKELLDAAGLTTRAKEKKAKSGSGLGDLVDVAAGALQSGRPVTLVTFAGDNPESSAYASEVFGGITAQLQHEGRPQWGLSPLPLKADAADDDIVDRGTRMKSRFVLTGRAGVLVPDTPPAFTIRLFATRTGELVWKETYELAQHDADDVADLIIAEVRKRVATPPVPVPPAPAAPAPAPGS